MMLEKSFKGGVNGQENLYTPEQIIDKLSETEIHINQGVPIAEATWKIGITEQTYYLMTMNPFISLRRQF